MTVALLWLLMPNAFSKMLPPEIRKAAPKREKKELVRLAGFWNLFWTGYVEMFFVKLGDFFGLDLLFRGVVKKKGLMLQETEHCEVCPLTGLICAGIGALI